MATSKDFITHIERELSHVPAIRTRAMFGEYALYCNEVPVAFICDETIFLKITEHTEKLVEPDTERGPCYPGSKDYFVIEERLLEKKEFMKKLLIACSEDVIRNKRKKKKK